MDEMRTLGDAENTLKTYFMNAMLENLQKPSLLQASNTNIRNADYYAKHEPEPLNPETHCIHCGHSLEDYDF